MANNLKTLKVPEDVWADTKIQAAKQRLSIADYVTDALAAYKKKLEEA